MMPFMVIDARLQDARRKTQDAREEEGDRRPLRCKTEEARQEEERSVEEV
jgi:hypothetical protein